MNDQFLEVKKGLPYLGVGLGLRRELASDTFANIDRIDWLEIVPENYMGLGGAARERLNKANSLVPLVSHGINLSLGATDELNQDYLVNIKGLLDRVDAPWWSDHLCFTSFGGTYMHDLLPLPFTREAVRHLVERIKIVQQRVERPFLIENISYYMVMPGSEMSEAQFLSEILEQSDCGLLFDVNNVYVNSINHGFNPVDYLDQIPLERAVQVHVAGHSDQAGDFNTAIDTHGSDVIEPVYSLLCETLKRSDVRAVMLERDQNYPQFSSLLNELDRIRQIAKDASPRLLSSLNEAGGPLGKDQQRRDQLRRDQHVTVLTQ